MSNYTPCGKCGEDIHDDNLFEDGMCAGCSPLHGRHQDRRMDRLEAAVKYLAEQAQNRVNNGVRVGVARIMEEE